MTGYQSKKAAAQDKLEQWDMPSEAFNDWWDSDYDDSTNPYEKDTFAYWAWAGWQAALAQPEQEPVEDVMLYHDDGTRIVRITAQRKPLTDEEIEQMRERTGDYDSFERCCPHDSDCAVHNMPAYPAGACDCTYKNTFNTPPSAKIHEVCLKLAKQELDKLTAENFGRTPNDAWTNKIVDVYHFFDSNPKAKNLTVLYTKAHQPKHDTPPAAQRKPLTDEAIQKVWDVASGAIPGWSRHIAYARAIEAAHGIKENT